ncbi:MAG: ABC transporter substrate-binding protein [Lachnospiraceae bacterium]|nr:ABC transporter substrate-binding protein [Lachnospiraceae bacterium]
MKNITALKKTAYGLILYMFCLILCSCAGENAGKDTEETGRDVSLKYATQFEITHYENGYKLIHISDGSDYVVVPPGKEDDNLGVSGAVIIHEAPENIYLAASSAMDLFVKLDALDNIGTCSTAASDYTIEEAREKIESDEIRYIGKYRSPDYEILLESECDLAIESTMITHSPEIKEEIERLGIPVLTERSSYEKHPLGRLEWIKLYGAILGKEEEAEAFFDREEEKVLKVLEELDEQKDTGYSSPKVAFFYVSPNGYINIRKPGDYVSTMIEMAGGSYVFDGVTDESGNALSTMNLDWEEFYEKAVEADILIYSGTIDGGIESRGELIDKNELFNDFKAVKTGNVFCSNSDMFQCTSLVADMIVELHDIINDNDTDDLRFIKKLKD